MATKRQKRIKKAKNIVRNNLPKNNIVITAAKAEGVIDRFHKVMNHNARVREIHKTVRSKGIATNPKELGI